MIVLPRSVVFFGISGPVSSTKQGHIRKHLRLQERVISSLGEVKLEGLKLVGRVLDRKKDIL